MKKTLQIETKIHPVGDINCAVTSLLKSVDNVNRYLYEEKGMFFRRLRVNVNYCGECSASVTLTAKEQLMNAFINAYLSESGVLTKFTVDIK